MTYDDEPRVLTRVIPQSWVDETEELREENRALREWGHGVIGACEMLRDATRSKNVSAANAAMAIIWNARDLFDRVLAEPVGNEATPA